MNPEINKLSDYVEALSATYNVNLNTVRNDIVETLRDKCGVTILPTDYQNYPTLSEIPRYINKKSSINLNSNVIFGIAIFSNDLSDINNSRIQDIYTSQFAQVNGNISSVNDISSVYPPSAQNSGNLNGKDYYQFYDFNEPSNISNLNDETGHLIILYGSGGYTSEDLRGSLIEKNATTSSIVATTDSYYHDDNFSFNKSSEYNFNSTGSPGDWGEGGGGLMFYITNSFLTQCYGTFENFQTNYMKKMGTGVSINELSNYTIRLKPKQYGILFYGGSVKGYGVGHFLCGYRKNNQTITISESVDANGFPTKYRWLYTNVFNDTDTDFDLSGYINIGQWDKGGGGGFILIPDYQLEVDETTGKFTGNIQYMGNGISTQSTRITLQLSEDTLTGRLNVVYENIKNRLETQFSISVSDVENLNDCKEKIETLVESGYQFDNKYDNN